MPQVTAIFGPPGTGKTHTLVEIAEKEARSAGKVAYLSYTRAAAQEATGRIANANRIEASTLHSMAYRFLNVQRSQVVSREKLQAFAAMIGVPFKGTEANTMDETQEGDEYLAVISYANAQRMDVHEAYERHGRPGTVRRFEMFEESYRGWKKEFGYIDFDDMLIRFVESPARPPVTPVLILDEAQDCSPLQWEVFSKIARYAKKVYIAGDDDQAIFEWNGADPHGMVHFAEENNGAIEVLGQSYRVPRAVWELTHEEILPQFHKRADKAFVCAPVEGLIERWGSAWDFDFSKLRGRDSRILVRDRFNGLTIQRMLNAEMIPYRMAGGFSPFDSRKANAIRAMIKANEGEVPMERERDCLIAITGSSKLHEGDWSDIIGQDWRKVLPLSASDHDFYESIDLREPLTIELSTIHQAKGKEAEVVVMDLSVTASVLDTIDKNRDSELRVWYVGCTRAKQELHLCGENPLL